MGETEVTEVLSDLAVYRKVAASTQNQALAALLFLYRQVLGVDLPWLDHVAQRHLLDSRKKVFQGRSRMVLAVCIPGNQAQPRSSLKRSLPAPHWRVGVAETIKEALTRNQQIGQLPHVAS